MKFIMAVDKVVATKQGHTIEFKKGVPTHVPRECYPEVTAAGAVAEDQEAVLTEKKTSKPEVEDAIEREKMIFMAFEDMVKENKRNDFAGTGQPTEKAVEKRVGFDVDPKELSALWTKFRQEAKV